MPLTFSTHFLFTFLKIHVELNDDKLWVTEEVQFSIHIFKLPDKQRLK